MRSRAARATPRRAAVAAVVLLALTAGCGAAEPPGERVPALREQLAKVDDAVVAEDPDLIRSTANGLALLAREAGEAGTLEADEVERIEATVRGLIAQAEDDGGLLPAPTEPETAEPEPESPDEDRAEDEKPEKEKPDKEKPGKLPKLPKPEKPDMPDKDDEDDEDD